MYQFCGEACECGLTSETQGALIASDYCRSVMALGGSPPNSGLKCLLLVRSRLKMRSSESGVKDVRVHVPIK